MTPEELDNIIIEEYYLGKESNCAYEQDSGRICTGKLKVYYAFCVIDRICRKHLNKLLKERREEPEIDKKWPVVLLTEKELFYLKMIGKI